LSSVDISAGLAGEQAGSQTGGEPLKASSQLSINGLPLSANKNGKYTQQLIIRPNESMTTTGTERSTNRFVRRAAPSDPNVEVLPGSKVQIDMVTPMNDEVHEKGLYNPKVVKVSANQDLSSISHSKGLKFTWVPDAASNGYVAIVVVNRGAGHLTQKNISYQSMVKDTGTHTIPTSEISKFEAGGDVDIYIGRATQRVIKHSNNRKTVITLVNINLLGGMIESQRDHPNPDDRLNPDNRDPLESL
jgi:hypothetical protein